MIRVNLPRCSIVDIVVTNQSVVDGLIAVSDGDYAAESASVAVVGITSLKLASRNGRKAFSCVNGRSSEAADLSEKKG